MIKDLAIIMATVCSLLLIGAFIGYQIHEPECPEYIFDTEYRFSVLENSSPIEFTLPTNQCGSTIIITSKIEEEDCIDDLDDCIDTEIGNPENETIDPYWDNVWIGEENEN
jgi:hypothetical protein